MATIHLIGGEKGGVGKSVVARLLAQYMIDNKVPFIGFDTDRSHGALLRYYADFAAPTVIDSYESLDSIMEAAASDPERHVLVDLAAQTFHPLARWIDESGVLELASELGITVRYWNVMDSGKDSVDLLDKLLEKFGSRLNYVVVLNELRDDNFTILESSGVKERAVAAGAQFIRVKRLHPAVMTKIDGSSQSFWAARFKTEGPGGLGLLERQRVKIWMDNVYREFKALGI